GPWSRRARRTPFGSGCGCRPPAACSCSLLSGLTDGRLQRPTIMPRTPTHRTRPGRVARRMDLFEYQGKQLFARFGIPVSEGRLATSPEEARVAAEELGGQVVVKAQVLI